MAPSLALLLPAVMSAMLLGLASAIPLALEGRQLQTCDAYALPTLKPEVTHAPVVDLVWVGADDQTVFAITRKPVADAGGVWRSRDGGSKWEELTPALNSSIGGNETVSIIQVFSQKSQPGNVVFMGSGTFMWVSHDYGATFKPVQTPGKWRGSGIKQLKQHPRKDNWLLVLVKRPNCRTLDKAQMECPHDLFFTEDLYNDGAWASKWQNLTANAKGKVAGFVDFDWGASACPSNNCTSLAVIEDKSIFATLYEKPGSYDMPWDPDVQFVVSTNLFSSYITQVRCGNMFEIIGHTIYLAFANSCPTDVTGNTRKDSPSFPKGITLFTSLDGGSTFDQACLPIALKQEGYELMETHDSTGAIIIVDFLVPTGFMDVPASSVYTAGPHHALFSLSLTDVFHADFGFSTDFSRVEGIPGVYIANQMLPRASTDDSSASSSDYSDLSDLTGAPLVETRITFNGGAQWQRIPAPTRINNPKCDRCDGQPQCFLHLHGMSSWDSMSTALPAVYSNPSAPGLVMATGNVGPVGVGLDDNDGLCTWLSSDGGSTWQDVGAGAYIYEFADWGGMVVMARHPGVSDKPAEEVLFSLDYGRCWQSAPLEQALLVDNIRIEPDGQRPRVIVHGRACRQSSSSKCSYTDDDTRSAPEGLVYVVDVQDLLKTISPLGQCVASNDYETWVLPTEAHTERCVLGKVMRFTHRKRDSKCINGPAYQRPVPANTSCACELTDVECDYGYIRDGSNSQCEPIPSDRMPTCPVVASKKYSVSSTGLRLVHADQCNGIEAIIKDTDGKGKSTGTPPPTNGGKKKKHGALFGFFMFLLSAAAVSGLAVAWWVYLATGTQRDTVRDVLGTLGAALASLWALVLEKLRIRRSQHDDLGYFQPLGDAGHHDMEERSSGGNLFTLK